MKSRLEEKPRTITWTETYTRDIVIGFRDCAGCGTETPVPTDAQMLAFAKYAIDHGRHFMWPAVDIENGCIPVGWVYREGELFCPGCEQAQRDALKARRSKS